MIKKLEPGETAPFTAHLDELRKRLIVSVAVIGVAFGIAYTVSEQLIMPFSALLDTELIFLTPTEAFFAHIKIAFYAALAVSVPVIFFQAWSFIAPGLLVTERKYTFRFAIASAFFFTGGAAFCYFMVLPFGLKFLLGYGGETLTPMMSISAYIGFCVNLMFVFGVVFQLPLVVLLLHKMGIVTIEALVDFRRYLVVMSFILAAVITPPDVFTQIVLSLPLILLYELTILFIKVFIRDKKKEDEKEKESSG